MNTCPVYRRSGGLSYGSTYSGPIGVIIDPTFNLRKYSSLPFASTLNGSCTSVCPVKINIHEQIYKWRQVIAERHQLPMVKKEAMRVAGKVLASPQALSRRRRGRGRGPRAPAALHRLQPLQRLGPAARGAGGAGVDLPPVVRQEPRGRAMSSRDHILARVRRNQPAWRALPEIPSFERPLADPWDAFAAALARMGGSVAVPPEGVALDAFVRARFPEARVICSATAEVAGTRSISTVRHPAELEDVDVGVVRAVFGVAETGSVWLSEREFGVNVLGFLSQHLVVLLDPSAIVPDLHHAYRHPGFFEARYAVFMTGPSATADIEGVLVRGAQGIRTLTVVPAAARRRRQRHPTRGEPHDLAAGLQPVREHGGLDGAGRACRWW